MKIATYSLSSGHGEAEVVEILPPNFDIYTKYNVKQFPHRYVPRVNQDRYVLKIGEKLRVVAKDKIYKVREK